MLTVKLDRSNHGPYCVHGVTATSARIQPINKPDEEVICVSLQRLSRCAGVSLDSVKPWLDHGKARRRLKLCRRTVLPNQSRLKNRISKVAVSRMPARMRMTVRVPSLDGR